MERGGYLTWYFDKTCSCYSSTTNRRFLGITGVPNIYTIVIGIMTSELDRVYVEIRICHVKEQGIRKEGIREEDRRKEGIRDKVVLTHRVNFTRSSLWATNRGTGGSHGITTWLGTGFGFHWIRVIQWSTMTFTSIILFFIFSHCLCERNQPLEEGDGLSTCGCWFRELWIDHKQYWFN